MRKLMRSGGVLLLAAPAAILASMGWPYSCGPVGEIKSAAARPARIEARLKFERDMAKRIDASRARAASIRAGVEGFMHDLMMEYDEDRARPRPLLMARGEIVAESEAEFDELSAHIKDLTARLAEQSREQGDHK